MPLRIFRRESGAATAQRSPACPARVRPRFSGFTDEWRIDAELRSEGGLAETLNRRDPLRIGDVRWAPLDGSVPLAPAPAIRTIDPYDLIVAIAGAGSPPLLSETDREAMALERTPYRVTLEATPFRITGTVFLLPGSEPASLLERGAELFAVVTEPAVQLNETPLPEAGADALLVNRSYVRQVRQVRPERTPGPRAGGPASRTARGATRASRAR